MTLESGTAVVDSSGVNARECTESWFGLLAVIIVTNLIICAFADLTFRHHRVSCCLQSAHRLKVVWKSHVLELGFAMAVLISLRRKMKECVRFGELMIFWCILDTIRSSVKKNRSPFLAWQIVSEQEQNQIADLEPGWTTSVWQGLWLCTKVTHISKHSHLNAGPKQSMLLQNRTMWPLLFHYIPFVMDMNQSERSLLPLAYHCYCAWFIFSDKSCIQSTKLKLNVAFLHHKCVYFRIEHCYLVFRRMLKLGAICISGKYSE